MNNTSLVSHEIHNAQFIRIATAAHVLNCFIGNGKPGQEPVERMLYNHSSWRAWRPMIRSNPRWSAQLKIFRLISLMPLKTLPPISKRSMQVSVQSLRPHGWDSSPSWSWKARWQVWASHLMLCSYSVKKKGSGQFIWPLSESIHPVRAWFFHWP